MKARYKYRIYPTTQQKTALAQLFGCVRVVWNDSLACCKDSANRYFLSFVVEIIPEPLPKVKKTCGIDLGITTFATFSNGEKVEAPKPLKKNLKRLRKLQRKLSKKQKGSKRREVARKKVAKLHAKIKDTRTDFLHKLSTKVVRENQSIALEDLNVSGMMKNRKLSRAISDLGWREFRTMLDNKADKHGRKFTVIDRWEPTTQTCSCCRQKGGKKELSIREWTCLWCGETHDRDVNAAVNVEVAGGHSETKNAHGGTGKTSAKEAPSDEVRTAPEWIQLDLFGESPRSTE